MMNLAACLKKMQESRKKGAEIMSEKKTPSVSTTALQINPRDFSNEFFVHARHGCNGCAISPIIGTRYHGSEAPNVDLCEACFTKYDGDKLNFTPEIERELSLYR